MSVRLNAYLRKPSDRRQPALFDVKSIAQPGLEIREPLVFWIAVVIARRRGHKVWRSGTDGIVLFDGARAPAQWLIARYNPRRFDNLPPRGLSCHR